MLRDPHAAVSIPTDLSALTPANTSSLTTPPQVGNLTEILIPYAHYRMRVRAEERSKIEGDCGKVRRTQAEKGLYLEQYDRELRLLQYSHTKTWTLPAFFSMLPLHP